jgi:hypothetical protein
MTRSHHPGCETEGLYQKYRVERTDGTDGPGQRHDGCRYLVLDLTHDPEARHVAGLYASNVHHERPRFADDLLALLEELEP